jgi:hypothetical protein
MLMPRRSPTLSPYALAMIALTLALALVARTVGAERAASGAVGGFPVPGASLAAEAAAPAASG